MARHTYDGKAQGQKKGIQKSMAQKDPNKIGSTTKATLARFESGVVCVCVCDLPGILGGYG
eukprot:2622636-Amphidinium_carterae.2